MQPGQNSVQIRSHGDRGAACTTRSELIYTVPHYSNTRWHLYRSKGWLQGTLSPRKLISRFFRYTSHSGGKSGTGALERQASTCI